MKRRMTLFANGTLSFLLVVSGLFVFAPVAHAFDQNMIMSDSEFENTGTMNASDIDAFLNRYGSSCISLNHGFRSPEPTGYAPSTSFTYGNDVSAGTVIYDAAQAYGLNPQVLITTLQKEESLVTGGSGCSVQQYAAALGDDCPDSGGGYSYSGFELYSINGVATTSVNNTCADTQSDVGFSRQVIVSAWKLRWWEQRSEGNTNWHIVSGNWDNSDDPGYCYSLLMTQGYRARCNGNAATYFDGSATIDGTGITLTNGATAALYDYTPHFAGNQSFVNIFQNTFGFGSTTSGMLSIAHPDGTLVRPANNPEVYLITNGKAQYATSLAVLQSWGYDMGQLKIATQGDLSLMTLTEQDTSHTNTPAPLQYRIGTLIKGSGSTIYVIENDTNGNNEKESLADWNNFTRLGYNIGQVLIVPDAQLPSETGSNYDGTQATHPDGTLVRDAGSNTVYYVLGGARHSLTSLPIFYGQRLSFKGVVTATAGDDQLPITWPITWYSAGVLLKGSGSTVYISDLDSTGVNDSKRSFGTYYNFVGLDYDFYNVMQVNDGDLPTTNGPAIGQ